MHASPIEPNWKPLILAICLAAVFLGLIVWFIVVTGLRSLRIHWRTKKPLTASEATAVVWNDGVNSHSVGGQRLLPPSPQSEEAQKAESMVLDTASIASISDSHSRPSDGPGVSTMDTASCNTKSSPDDQHDPGMTFTSIRSSTDNRLHGLRLENDDSVPTTRAEFCCWHSR